LLVCSLAGCKKEAVKADPPAKVEQAPDLEAARKAQQALDAQRSGVNTLFAGLRQQVGAIPADAPGFGEIRGKFYTAEQARSLMDYGVPLLAQRLEAAVKAGKPAELWQVSQDIDKAAREMRELQNLGHGLLREVSPYTRMLSLGDSMAATMTFTRVLPGGYQVQGVKGGIEERLLQLAEDPKRKLDKSWLDFERVAFANDGSELDLQRSKAQLENVFEILKAYPNVKLELGGYTADSGLEPANKSLAGSRADTVRNELVRLGLAASRIERKGTGAEHPICVAKPREQCKGKSGRVAARVTAK
jgi:outer membrane protein OmpA-like peptidoglycan-associated protein